jgi:phospholipase/lecithinase/hemolysin
MVRLRSILLFSLVLLFSAVPVYADSSLSQIIVFGDSNTDTGANDEGSIYNLTGGAFNGPPNAEVTGVLSQLDMFEEDLDGGFADHRALYIYWAGSNDIYQATPEAVVDVVPLTATALDNIEYALTRLTELGARNILVATRATRPDFSTENNINGVIFNAALRTRIMALDGELRSNIQIYEAFDFITDMMFYPADYGFTEPTALCIEDEQDLVKNEDGELVLDLDDEGPWCSTDLDIAAGYVQWDGAHKTTRVHKIMAEKMVQQVKLMRTGNKKGPKKIK